MIGELGVKSTDPVSHHSPSWYPRVMSDLELLCLRNGEVEWKRLGGGSPSLNKQNKIKKKKRVSPELLREPPHTEKLSQGTLGMELSKDRNVSSAENHLHIWNSMSGIYSLIYFVALNKIICTRHQGEKCCHTPLLCVLKHTQHRAWVPEPNLCIFSMFTVSKTTILTYLFSFKLRTDRLLRPHGDSFSEQVSWESGLCKKEETLFWSLQGSVWVLALILTSCVILYKSLNCSEPQ